jgi:oligoribonuclease NrnB/cAMP/cGMP phosphodiesterase (DHH superfamily)
MYRNNPSVYNKDAIVNTDVVLFHAGCPDGVGAAFAFYLFHRQKGLFNKEYIAVRHYQPCPEHAIKDKNVAIVDFSYSEKITKDIAKKAKNVIILDHHKTAYDNLKNIEKTCNNIKFIFDSERSGAQIAWDYVYNNEPRPMFIDYIADRDLWKWEMNNSKNINSGMYYKGYTKSLESMYNLYISELTNKYTYTALNKTGSVVNNTILSRCKLIAKNSTLVWFHDIRTRVTTAECSIVSDLADYVLQSLADCDILLNYNYYINEGWRISLRSNTVDLTHIVKKYENGGGHPAAANFKLDHKDHILNHVKLIQG